MINLSLADVCNEKYFMLGSNNRQYVLNLQPIINATEESRALNEICYEKKTSVEHCTELNYSDRFLLDVKDVVSAQYILVLGFKRHWDDNARSLPTSILALTFAADISKGIGIGWFSMTRTMLGRQSQLVDSLSKTLGKETNDDKFFPVRREDSSLVAHKVVSYNARRGGGRPQVQLELCSLLKTFGAEANLQGEFKGLSKLVMAKQKATVAMVYTDVDKLQESGEVQVAKLPNKIKDVLCTAKETVKMSALNDKLDVVAGEETLKSIADTLRDEKANDLPIFNRNDFDTRKSFKSFSRMVNQNIGLDVKKSIEEEAAQLGRIYSAGTSVDLDSLILTCRKTSDEFLRTLETHAAYVERSGQCDGVSYGSDLMSSNKLYDMLLKDSVGKALVKMAIDRGWILGDELSSITTLDDGRVRCVNGNNIRLGLVSKPTMGCTASCLDFYSLPVMDHSTEPCHAWVRLKHIDVYQECMRRIAWHLNMEIFCASQYQNGLAIVSKDPLFKNTAKVVGGLWLHRLAFILYQAKHPSDDVATYMEETYGMKSKAMAVQFGGEYNLTLSHDAQRAITHNLFQVSETDSAPLAMQLAAKVCKQGVPRTMLRFYFLGLCRGIINYGIGAQTRAIKVYDDKEKLPALLYPGMFSHLKDEQGIGGPFQRTVYANGGLPPGLAGYTERLNYDAEIMGNDNNIKLRRSSTEKKTVAMPAQEMQSRLWRNDAGPKSSSSPHRCELIRAMVYYNCFRHAPGGSNLPYSERASTKIQLTRNRYEVSSLDEKSQEMANISISYLAQQIDSYGSLVNFLITSVGNNAGFRSELAFLCNGLRVGEIPLWNDSQFNEDRFQEAVLSSIREPVQRTIQKLRTCHFLKASDVRDYCYMNINGYLCAYNLCLIGLNRELTTTDRESISFFGKHIQDYLAIFYTGSSKKQSIGLRQLKLSKKLIGSFYHYEPFLPRKAARLNRPHGICLPFPKCLLAIYDKTQANVDLFLQVVDSQYVLCHRCETNASRKRHNKLKSVLLNGSSQSNKVWVCGHPTCPEKYFFCSDSLFYHLAQETSHSTNDHAKSTTIVTRDVANHVINFIKESCTEEQKPILESVLEGKNVIISGNGGTGKSFFMRKLLKCMYLIHDDWRLNDDKTTYSKSRVHGVCTQQLQAQNISTNFVTLHKLCGIKDLNFPNIANDSERDKYCREFLSTNPDVKEKLRKIEVIFVDEYGMFADHQGVYLQTLLRVARGMEDVATISARTAHNGQDDDDDDDDDDNEDEDDTELSRAYDVQWIFCGQATQLPPFGNFISWALNTFINENAIPYHLTVAFRNDGDTRHQLLVTAAKIGACTLDDLTFIATQCGQDVKPLMESTNIMQRFKVVSLYYTHVALREGIESTMLDLRTRFQRNRISFVRVNAIHSVTTGKSFGYGSDPVVMNRSSNNPRINSMRTTSSNELVVDPENDNDIFFEDNEKLSTVPWLVLTVGMPVILTDKLSSQSITLVNLDGSKSTRVKTNVTIAKNTQGIVKHIRYTEGCTEEKSDDYITIEVSLITEAGVHRNFLLDTKRIASYCKCTVGDVPNQTLTRLQFPLANGLCISWSTIQGMTIPYVYIDLNQNRLIYTSRHEFPALWHVTIGRVRSTRGIYLHGLESILKPPVGQKDTGDKDKIIMKFFNCVKQASVQFENDFIERAQQEIGGKNRVIAKVSHRTVFLEHQKATYSFGAKAKAVRGEINYDKLNECRKTLATSLHVLAQLLEKAVDTCAERQKVSTERRMQCIYTEEMKAAIINGSKVFAKINEVKPYYALDDNNLLLRHWEIVRDLCMYGVSVRDILSSPVRGAAITTASDFYDYHTIFEAARAELPSSDSMGSQPHKVSSSSSSAAWYPGWLPQFQYINDMDATIKAGIIKAAKNALDVAYCEIPSTETGTKKTLRDLPIDAMNTDPVALTRKRPRLTPTMTMTPRVYESVNMLTTEADRE